MVTFLPRMRVAMVCPIESIDSIVDIVACMRVHDVDDDEKPEAVGLVYEILEVIRGALTG